ncbi:sugar ABC transporter substrate-binding protein [Paenibacillus sp. FSL R10-2734]|uniref:ABC transporter substrate-binding protein n=1 Tax=Paenibacillus sp. FSL R10-2734 TaxID=2954691 RepID=UPI0030D773B5
MSKLKKGLTAMLATMLFTVVAGCNSAPKANPDSSASNDSQTSTTAPAKKPGEKSIVKFMYWGSPAEKAAVEQAITDFETANPDIMIQGVNIPGGDFYTKLTAMIAGNEAPDLSYSGPWKLKLGEDGFIYEFNELAKKYPEMSQEGLVKYAEWKWAPDKSAGPFQASVTPTLVYNKQIFKDLGVELPPTKAEEAWSWDEFVQVAQQLTLDNKGRNALDPNFDEKNIKQFGVKFNTGWNGYMPLVLSSGGNYLSADGAEFGLNKPEATNAIQKVADLINVHHVNPTPSQAKSIPAPATALQSKRVAMTVDGSWTHADLALTDMDWGVGVLPQMGDSYKTFFHGGSIIIYKNAKDIDATLKFYNWITSPESVLTLHQGLWLPQYDKYYTDPEYIDKWANESLPGRPEGFQDAVMKSTFENAVLAPEQGVKNFQEIDPLVTAALDEVWSGKKTAQEAMDGVLPKVKPLIKGWYFND